jgi:hypothetical protein
MSNHYFETTFPAVLRGCAAVAVLIAASLVNAPASAQGLPQSSPNMGSVSATATGTGTITASYNVAAAMVQSNSVYFTFHVPYALADARVQVNNLPNSAVPLDYVGLFDQNTRSLSLSQSPSRSHTVAARVGTGYYRIIIGPQFRQPGIISFTVTVTVQNAQSAAATAVPMAAPTLLSRYAPNMCNPAGNLGTIPVTGFVRSGINIGAGQFECYNLNIGSSQLTARFITFTLSGLPATGTKTFSLYDHRNQRWLIQGQNFFVQSYQTRLLLGDGAYQMIIVAGADARDRGAYGFSIR